MSSRTPVDRLLTPTSVAVVGASARPGSFGERLAVEALRSPGVARVHLVHPEHREVAGRRTVPRLDDLDDAPEGSGAFADAFEVTPATARQILACFTVRSETAPIVTDSKGQPEPDPGLRDTESVPLYEDIDTFLEKWAGCCIW